MQFRVLGPLRVFGNDGQELRIPGKIKARLISTFLYAHFRGTNAVRTDLLAEAAWGDAGGRSHDARLARLRQELTHLRKLFTPEERISHIQRGLCRFELTADDSVDAIDFQAAVAASREAFHRGDTDFERTTLLQAKQMWTDRPFVDIEEQLFDAADGIALLNQDCEYVFDRLRVLGRPSELDSGSLNALARVASRVESTSIETEDSNLGGGLDTAGAEIHLHHLSTLSASAEILVGRERELEALTEAWHRPSGHIIGLVGVGGVGKTHLINHWVAMMAAQASWRNASVFGFTFAVRHDTEELGARIPSGIEANVSDFFDEALRFAGEEDPGAIAPKERGRHLARLLQKRRTLLILDGLEALQSTLRGMEPGQGRLLENSIADLLRGVAIENPGLCVVTSRVRIPEITGVGATRMLRLDGLDTDNAAALLAVLTDSAPDSRLEERRSLAVKCAGHPLTLSVLGNYIRIVHGGDVLLASDMDVDIADSLHGGLLGAVLERYDTWLGAGPERSLMRLMGLFDATATEGQLEALREKLIPEMAPELSGLGGEQWQVAIANLRDYGLLAGKDPDHPNDLTAHPLIRKQMARRLDTEYPGIWRRGHEVLYRHFSESLADSPATRLELKALMLAVRHGCIAGLHAEVLEEIIWKSLSVGFDYRAGFYSATNSYRMLGPDLDIEVIRYFFGSDLADPLPGLNPKQQCRVLNWAGTVLRMLGRLGEAEKAHRAGWDLCSAALTERDPIPQTQDDIDWWECIGAHGSYFGRLLTVRGLASEGYHYTRVAYERAREIDFPSLQRATCNVHADSMHWLGQLDAAERLFREGELIDLRGDSRLASVMLVQVFQRNELRIDRAEYDLVLRDLQPIAEGSAGIALPDPFPGLAKLLVAQASLAKLEAEHSTDLEEVKTNVDDIVVCLRRFGLKDYLARAIKLAATVSRLEGDYIVAHSLAEEALDSSIASYCLIEPSCWLEQGRIFLAEGDFGCAEESGRQARHSLRNKDLPLHIADCDIFDAELAQARGMLGTMSDHLAAAETAVRTTGYLRVKDQIDTLKQALHEQGNLAAAEFGG